MTLRKGQKLSNYVYLKCFGNKIRKGGNISEHDHFLRMAHVEQYIFYMSDEEFEEAIK